MKAIEVRRLYHSYDDSEFVLRGIDFDVEPGEVVVLLGSSGAGKSTLLRCLNFLVKPTRGEILLEGQDILCCSGKKLYQVRRKMGMIFQEFNLINRTSVLENVMLGRLGYNSTLRSVLNWFPPSEYEVAWESLEKVGMAGYAYEIVANLSGGERQRVGIARALSQKPRILLADEPVSNLDPKLMVEIMDLLMEICASEGLTLLASLHFVELAKRYAGKLIGIREGTVVFDDHPSLLGKREVDEIYGGTKEWILYGEAEIQDDPCSNVCPGDPGHSSVHLVV